MPLTTPPFDDANALALVEDANCIAADLDLQIITAPKLPQKRSRPVNKFLRITTTWSVVAWTPISLVRWFWAYRSHDWRKFDECLYIIPSRGGWWDRECIAEMDIIYHAEVSTIWTHWWVLTIILCLLWLMVRYENLKTQKEE